MSCFSCFASQEGKSSRRLNSRRSRVSSSERQRSLKPGDSKKEKKEAAANNEGGTKNNIAAQTFTFRELAAATKNFRQECLIGEGGFGRVYKGQLEKTGQIVAVKQLDRNGLQGNKEFLVEVFMLSLLHHPNLVSLIGYCSDGDQRLLVYEYMPLGCLEDHLLDLPPNQPALDWSKRMKIALHAARGLEYLHEKANPPVIYRDLKSSNILLDNDFNGKLSDFGLAKVGPVGDKSHVSSRIMGTYGYCAPEYQRTGHLSVKSDVYSFGVVLLELITGKRAVDPSRKGLDQMLVSWADPIFKDQSRHMELLDPLIKGNVPQKSYQQVVAVAAMCLEEDPEVRPLMTDVVSALGHLSEGLEMESSAETNVASSSEHQDNSNNNSVDNSNNNNDNGNSNGVSEERQKAVAEAIEWGSNSRNQNA